jgi:outer membrane lipoprotein
MGRLAGLILLGIFWPELSGAASPVPAEIYAEIDHGLRPAAVLADPEAYRGRILLLGGTVERTVSEAAGVSLIVACESLDADDYPSGALMEPGRILAAGTGLDGAKLQPGRLVTLVGRVVGWNDPGPAKVPQLEIRYVHSWPTSAEEEAARTPHCAPGYWCDPWWYDPWCDPWYCGPYSRWRFGAGYYRHWH